MELIRDYNKFVGYVTQPLVVVVSQSPSAVLVGGQVNVNILYPPHIRIYGDNNLKSELFRRCATRLKNLSIELATAEIKRLISLDKLEPVKMVPINDRNWGSITEVLESLDDSPMCQGFLQKALPILRETAKEINDECLEGLEELKKKVEKL